MADFWGGVKSADIAVESGGVALGKGSCDKAWIMRPTEGLVGYLGASSRPTGMPSDCLSRYVDGSDALAVRFASPDEYTADSGLTSSATARGPLYLRSKVGFGGRLFDVRVANLDEVKTALPGGPESGVFNHKFQIAVFHIQTNDFGSGPVPTLAMLKLDATSLLGEQLVDGIEMLAFAYGLDTTTTFRSTVIAKPLPSPTGGRCSACGSASSPAAMSWTTWSTPPNTT